MCQKGAGNQWLVKWGKCAEHTTDLSVSSDWIRSLKVWSIFGIQGKALLSGFILHLYPTLKMHLYKKSLKMRFFLASLKANFEISMRIMTHRQKPWRSVVFRLDAEWGVHNSRPPSKGSVPSRVSQVDWGGKTDENWWKVWRFKADKHQRNRFWGRWNCKIFNFLVLC